MYARRWILFLGLAVAGCAADLSTKAWVFHRLGHYQIENAPARSPMVLVDGVFSFETHLNEGALFGIGQRRIAVFVSLSFVAIAGIFAWMTWGGAVRDRLLTVALGLVLGGILGNLYDRLGLANMTWSFGVPGHAEGERVYAVRDWVHFQIESIGFDWAIFNIADSLLVVGAGLLLWHAIWYGHESAQDESAVAASSQAGATAATSAATADAEISSSTG